MLAFVHLKYQIFLKIHLAFCSWQNCFVVLSSLVAKVVSAKIYACIRVSPSVPMSIADLCECVPAWKITIKEPKNPRWLYSWLDKPRQLKELFKAGAIQEIIYFPLKKLEEKENPFPQRFPTFCFKMRKYHFLYCFCWVSVATEPSENWCNRKLSHQLYWEHQPCKAWVLIYFNATRKAKPLWRFRIEKLSLKKMICNASEANFKNLL